jgi:WhiB family transcriptional regulator, redox-sensing transcriptional regulator
MERAAMWWDWAACREEDPELFFPLGSGLSASLQTTSAKAICRRCPVLEQCLRWAVAADLREGMCGGTTPQERVRGHEEVPTGS